MTLKRGAVLVAMSLLVLGIVIAYAKRPSNDFKVYVGSGEAVLQGKDIYQVPLPSLNTCPPVFSVFCVVPALLDRVSPGFARAVWLLVNLSALFLALRVASGLIHGARLPVWSPALVV